ncbi:RING finger protein [Caproiciproducens sp. R2]|uniref:RING finger protein n=1 Tax=Caproiciproducens sp. R2 TaxID=3435187 RepID=UPI0040340F68
MIDYTGLNCPVCGKPFARDDDIVVCPECGAPYHRECYAKVGKCVFSDKHGTPAAWTPPQKEPKSADPAASGAENRTKRCPRCGSLNSQNAMFCDHCGQSLTMNQQDVAGFPKSGGFPQNGFPRNGFPQNGFPQAGGPFPPGQPGQPVPFIFDPMGGVNPNEPIGSVPAGDLAKLVQGNTQYYLPVFLNLKRFHRNRFNFSAFLFSGGWMLYRKQYRIGSVITAVMTVLYLISTYVSLNFSMPLLESLMQQQGISIDTVSPTYSQLLQVSEQLAQQPVQQILLFCVPTIIALIQIAIMLVVGFNGNKWYLNHCIGKIEQIHRHTPEATLAAIQLQEQGGVNTSLAIGLLICYMIVFYLPQIF